MREEDPVCVWRIVGMKEEDPVCVWRMVGMKEEDPVCVEDGGDEDTGSYVCGGWWG